MDNQKESKFRIVYRRSSLAVKCIILAAILMCSGVLCFLGVSIVSNRRETEALKAQGAELEQENEKIRQNTNELGTPQSTQRIAREELGLVDKDTIIFETTE